MPKGHHSQQETIDDVICINVVICMTACAHHLALSRADFFPLEGLNVYKVLIRLCQLDQ